MHKNSHSACMHAVFEGLISMLWVPLNLACQDSSFGTLQRPIRQMVIEILVSNWRNLKNSQFIFGTSFHNQGGKWPQSYGHCWIWHVEMLLLAHCKVQSDKLLWRYQLPGKFQNRGGPAGGGGVQYISKVLISNKCIGFNAIAWQNNIEYKFDNQLVSLCSPNFVKIRHYI